MFTCPICKDFARNSYVGILRHIGQVHSHRPGFSVQCGLGRSKCPATYKNFQSFRSHVYKKHRDDLFLYDQVSGHDENEGGDEFEEPDNSDEESSEYSNHLSRAAAQFILKTTEVHNVSQVIFVNNCL